MRDITRRDLARRYGYFLDHVLRTESLDRNAGAATLVTPERVERYIAELKGRVGSVTAYGSIYKLRRIAEILAPNRDYTWLTEIEKDLELMMEPKSKLNRLVYTNVIAEAGLTLMAAADAAPVPTALARARQFRNGLMIAFLALHPIRLKNFAGLEIGSSFVKVKSQWWIVLAAADTEEGQPDDRLLDDGLTSWMDRYLSIHRLGDEFGPMLQAANQIAAVLQGIRGTTEVKVEDVTGMPILEIRIDKAEIARHGLSLSAVQDVIGIAVGGRPAGLVFEGDRRFQIVVRLSDFEPNSVEVLKNLPVPLPGSSAHVGEGAVTATLPLRVLAEFNLSEGPNQVSRENGKRRVVVTADVRGRDIGSAVAEAEAKIAQKVTLPPGYWLTWGGQFENFTAARQRLTIVVPVCSALIFLLLLGALGSWRDALLVFSAVPLALTGGVAALWLRDMTFSISSAVGFIALSGVAVLNGLVMLTFIRQLVREGVARDEAIYRGALTRLRPVVMTSLVASLGFVPMAIATGCRSPWRRS
jgi:hypothetical protein